MKHGDRITEAIKLGDWSAVHQEASAWSEAPDAGPRAFFALNVVYLLRGDFGNAWRVHAKCLQEPGDIQDVQEWVDQMRSQITQRSAKALLRV